MEHLHEVKNAFSKHGYVLVVITTPTQNLWREDLAKVVGKKNLGKYSNRVHAWLTENASAWELVTIESLCPNSGITGFAVPITRESALCETIKMVIEMKRSQRENGMIADIYEELGASRPTTHLRS